MSEHRRIWPLLAYGGLAAIAAVFRKDTDGILGNDSPETLRKPYRTSYPALDERRHNSGNPSPDRSREPSRESRSASKVDPDKRPQEQIENDQPLSAQLSRAKEKGRGRHAVVPWEIPWTGWKDIFWRVYASV